MSDTETLKKVAELWIELGGDAEGVTWCWQELRNEVERQLSSDNAEAIRDRPEKDQDQRS